MSVPSASATIQAVDPNFCIASWRQVFAVIWRHETTMAGVLALRSTFSAFVATNPAVRLLTIVEARAPLPTAQVRQGLADFLGQQGAHIKRSAVVFEGEGFRAAAVRGVVTGLTMLARPPYPHKIFGKLSDASVWLSSDSADTSVIEPQQIVRVLGELRASLEPAARTG